MKKIKIILFILFTSVATSFAQSFNPVKYKSIDGFQSLVLDVAFSPKTGMFALTTGDNRVELYDNKFVKIWSYQGNAQNNGGKVLFTPDEKYLIFTKYQSKSDVAVLRILDKKIIQSFKAHSTYLASIAMSSDGKLLATGGDDKKLKLWKNNNDTWESAQTIDLPDPDFQYLYALDFSSDGKYLAAAGIADNIYIYSVKGNSLVQLQSIPYKYWVYSLCFHAADNALAVGSSDQNMVYAKNKSGQYEKTFGESNSGGNSWGMSFDNSGNYLLQAKESSVIKVFKWKNNSLENLNELEMHGSDVFQVRFSADGNFMVSCSDDKTAIIWQLNDKVVLHDKAPTKGVKLIDNAEEELKNNEPQAKGKNFLFVIGINDYQYWPHLMNATKDAHDVKDILLNRYEFEKENVVEIYNDEATYKNILEKFSSLKSRIKENDNLLIYFSGHGFYNKDIDEGYWIPVNAHKGEENEYLPNSTLLKYIKAITAKHIFLVADACFSGALFSQTSRGYTDKVEQFKSRWGLTSGRLEAVSDGISGTNSPFASFFIKYLTENKNPKFPVSELIQYVKVSVSNNSEQTPIGNPLKNVGDEGGEFIFYLKK